MIFARMIISMPVSSSLFGRLGRYGTEAEILTLGMLCGFPVGAKSAVFLYQNGSISKKRAEFICAFTNNASITFLLSYTGIMLFSDIRIGIRLALFQLVSSLVTAAVLRGVFMGKEDFIVKNNIVAKNKTNLTEAVTDSAYTMLSICAFIITFMVLGELALSITSAEGFWGVIMKGLFEFSSGCASAATLEPDIAFVAISIIVGFSGLCVIMQVLSVIRGILSARMYILGRLINTVVFGICMLLFGIT